MTTDGAKVTYTPGANYAGVDTFTHTVSDPFGDSRTGTVSLENYFPVAMPDAATTTAGHAVIIPGLANDYDGTDLVKIIGEGDGGFFAPGDLVHTFSLLKPIGGSPGAGRGQANGNTLYLFATSNNRQQGLVRFDGATAETNVLLGDFLHSTALPAASWARLSLPSTDASGSVSSLLGSLHSGVGGITGAGAKGIFQTLDAGAHWEPVARLSDQPPGHPAFTIFSAIKDPVNAPDSAGVAFLGTARGPGTTPDTNDGIWYRGEGGDLTLVAREGSEPPGADHAKWKSFTSLALPGGGLGPLFTAFLQKGPGGTPGPGGITGLGDFGLYGMDGYGILRELVRENRPLLGNTVRTFSVLKAGAGSAGSARAFNNHHHIVLLVTFVDRSTAIVDLELPGPSAM